MIAHAIKNLSIKNLNKIKKLPVAMPARDFSYATSRMTFFEELIVRYTENLSGKYKIYKLYQEWAENYQQTNEEWYDAGLRLFNLSLNYNQEKLKNIPRDGPLVFISNHPHGVIDGFVSCHLLSQIRKDFKLVVTSALFRIEAINEMLLCVPDPREPDARQTSIKMQKETYRILHNKGAIIIYPAGDVSTVPTLKDKIAVDSQWYPFIARLIQKTNATVVPVFIGGQNSFLFQLMSFVTPNIRASLYMNELCRAMGKTININIGEALTHDDLKSIGDEQDIIRHLREKTYQLGDDLRK